MRLKSHPDILLKDHLRNVAEASRECILKKNLNLEIIEKSKLAQISYLIGVAHDFGKCTDSFQQYIRGKTSVSDSHAPVSSVFGYWLVKKYSDEHGIDPIFSAISALVIKKHHGNLENFINVNEIHESKINSQMKEISKKKSVMNLYENIVDFSLAEFSYDYSTFQKDVSNTVKRIYRDQENVELFLICELLFSVLLDFDKKHAAGILEIGHREKIIDDNIVEDYLNFKRKENPKKFDPDKPLNRLKNDFFSTVTCSRSISKSQKIYSITAPTGIGKTFTAFSVAVKLQNIIRKPYKIIYILPYTSIIDQNFEEIKKILQYQYDDFQESEKEYIIKQHYLADFKPRTSKYGKIRYNQELLLINSWDSNVIVSTYVQLLMSVIGYKGSFLNKFHNIVNSIILLDEVQFIDVSNWELVRKVLTTLSKKFNVYFVLMTATQPKIFDDSVELSDDRFFENTLTSDKISPKLFDKPEKTESFADRFFQDIFEGENRILIILNTRKSCYKVYKDIDDMHEFKDYEKFYLSTLLTPIDRRKKIEKIKEIQSPDSKYVVVTTQLIEAGVDITSDICVRDFSPLDSIIQCAGRCNRYNEINKGKFVLFDSLLNEEERRLYGFVYRDKFIIEKTREVLSYGFDSFHKMADMFFDLIKGSSSNFEALEDVERLRFSEISEHFKVIEDSLETVGVLIIKNRSVKELLNRYFELLEDEEVDSFEKFAKLKVLKRKMMNYTVNIYKKDLEEIDAFVKGNNIKYIPSDVVENIYSCKEGLKIFDKSSYMI